MAIVTVILAFALLTLGLTLKLECLYAAGPVFVLGVILMVFGQCLDPEGKTS